MDRKVYDLSVRWFVWTLAAVLGIAFWWLIGRWVFTIVQFFRS